MSLLGRIKYTNDLSAIIYVLSLFRAYHRPEIHLSQYVIKYSFYDKQQTNAILQKNDSKKGYAF